MGQFNFELSPPPGIFADETDFSGQGRWIDGSNVRFRQGRAETLGRIVYICGTELFAGATSANSVFAYTQGSAGAPIIVVGAANKVYRGVPAGSGLTDITPAGAPSTTYWAFASWGDYLVAAPKGGTLYIDSGAGLAAVVASTGTTPASINHMLITQERQILCLGTNEEASGTYNPLCIRGCDLEDYTVWATTASNNAFEHILEGEGKIVAGRRIGPYVAVWTDGAMFLGQFIGDPSQTYRFDYVATVGLKGPAAVAIMGGVAYWMSPDHAFYRWAPGALPELIACSIRQDLLSNINVANRQDTTTFAVSNSALGEVFWWYPDIRDVATGGYRYVAFSSSENCWFRGQLDRRAGGEFTFLSAPSTSLSARSWRPMVTVDSSGSTGGTGAVYCHEVENTGLSANVPWFIQSADQYLNDGRVRVMVRGCVPDFKQQTDDITMTIYAKDRPRSSAVTKGPYTIAATDTRKHFRASGMLLSVKIEGNKGQARPCKPVFDCVTMGER